MRRLAAATVLLSIVVSADGLRAQETAAAPDPAVLEAQQKRVAVVEKAAPAVVAIFGAGGGGGGSGVLISPDGYALTNYHVTSGAGDFQKCGLNDGKLYDAVIVGIDPTGDVALIKLLGRTDFPFAPMGDSDKVRPGDWCYAMGNPFLLATDFAPTVTFGIVSGTHRYQYPAGTFLEYTDCIQTDASINPGNSGGPLFNADGEIIGINGRGSFEKRGRVNSGAGYAISINQCRNFLGHLKSGRIVDHATLGAQVNTDSSGAVVVNSILEVSEAYRRGLRLDDEIVSFAGRPIRSVNQFKNILGIYPKGWKVPLVYRHEEERHEVFVRLRGLHRRSEFLPRQRRPQPQPRPRPDRDPEKPDDGKPDGKPEDGKPDEKEPDEKKPEPPRRPLPMRPAAKPPEQYKHMLVKKEGYANYWFNQEEQERVLKPIQALGDWSNHAGLWTLTGKLPRGEQFVFTLSQTPEVVGVEWPRATFVQEFGPDDKFKDEPPGTGGLLVAMRHLRLLLIHGPDVFTEFYYLGTEPLDGNGPMVDVLVSTLTGVESRWYVHEDGRFAGFDTRLSEDVDECEVRFGDLMEVEGRRFPKQLTVRHAGLDYNVFNVESAAFRAGKAPEIPKKKAEEKEDKEKKGEEQDANAK